MSSQAILSQQSLWRCLIACGVDTKAATRIASDGSKSFSEALAEARRAQSPATQLTAIQPSAWIDLSSPAESPAIQNLVETLASMPQDLRRAVVATVIGQVPADQADLEAGLAWLEELHPDEPAAELLAPLAELDAPQFQDALVESPNRWSTTVLPLAAGLFITGGLAMFLSQTNEVTSQPTTTTAASTSSVLPPVETPKAVLNPDLFREPDRKIEVAVSESNTLVRTDPAQGQLIWESEPFKELQIISINPNTITIESRGYRLFINLDDGTLLPP